MDENKQKQKKSQTHKDFWYDNLTNLKSNYYVSKNWNNEQGTREHWINKVHLK